MPLPCIPPSVWVIKFYTIQNNKQSYSLCIVIITFLDSKLEDKRYCTEW
jgi:hypothetical protein